jgi:hypothetical protein
MDIINRQSKTTSFMHLQFLLAAPWLPERVKTVEFQRALLDSGLDFTQTNLYDRGFVLNRVQASPLQVKLDASGPQLMTLQIVAQNPQYDLDMFCRDCQAAISSYVKTWPAEHYQVLSSTAKIHHLYSSKTHAFQYLWESRLGQRPDDFRTLGNRPVAGGGLRLLMPPHAKEGAEPVSIELRIESFLRETNKLFVETVFTWPKPRILKKEEDFAPGQLMESVEQFAAEEVWNFITQSRQEQG